MKTLEQKVASYLRFHCFFLYRELKTLKERMKKVVKYLRSHKNEPHILPVKLFYLLVKKVMIFRKNYLKNKIVVLRKKIDEYKAARAALKQGNKSPVIKLLEKIRKNIPSYISLPFNSEYGSASVGNPSYDEVNNLIAELSATAWILQSNKTP